MFEVYNNQDLANQLVRAVQTGKLHHANLISSGPGEDALPIALKLAKLLLCETQSECGKCRNCTRVDKLEHPDLNLTFPFVSGGNTGTSDDFLPAFRSALLGNQNLDPDSWQQKITSSNQQLQIPVKEIQNIHHKLSLTAAEGKNRVLLLWMPESIKSVASNKLLKLIEEPLPNTFLILVSHRKGRLLPTITSRCAPWTCKPLEADAFKERFKEVEPSVVKLLEMVFSPNLGAAITAIADPESTQIDSFASWMRICYKGNPVEISNAVTELTNLSKEALKTLIYRSMHFLERGFYHNVQATPEQATDLGAINVQKLSSAVIPSGTAAITKALSACLYDLERNVHAKTSLTYASYTLHKAFRGN
jgi:DNA polymerase-3 subunit delta'